MLFPQRYLVTSVGLLRRLRNRHFLLFDVLALVLTPTLALYLRTDELFNWEYYQASLLLYTLAALVIRLLIFQHYGLYRRYWRFVSSLELAQIGLAIIYATFLVTVSYLLARLTLPWFNLPRSVPLIDAMLCFLWIGGFRASIRLTESWAPTHQSLRTHDRPTPILHVAIVGAGYTGALLAREMRSNDLIHLHPVAFLDDDPAKHGMQIHGIPVYGGRQRLPQLLQAQPIDRVIIAMPTAPGTVIREITQLCRRAGVATQIMPGLHELLNGTISFSHLRNVQIEDLLRRAPIQTDTLAVNQQLQGKRILVTGGGGSIGSELCRQILRCRPAQLLLVGHGENSIFEISNELQRLQNETQASQPASYRPTLLTPVIADLRFPARINAIFKEHRPHVVFHAAAHKHVPLMEQNPVEAITNNVWGTKILLDAAQQAKVERFVMISTDKAVNPTNVMGASKRTAELLVLQAARTSGRFYQVVRFGNVLGSRGSVIHTFKHQIAAGGPVTVTHPDMLRYFMTIPEAVQLVLQAAVVGRGGEVLMLDMGDPVRIVDLAKDLIELSGLTVGKDIDIEFTGLRPGEKLFEEMFTPNEAYAPTQHQKILVAHNASHSLPSDLTHSIERLILTALANDADGVLRLLHLLLPEYQPAPQSPIPSQGHEEPTHEPRLAARPLHPLLTTAQ
ncbi:MAG: polysaccharide biosynthesis protein [Caldilineaceae bacterium]|nr:polysaccharide biosynthesis protein [Caldilineaceae bacterium]